MLDGSPDQIISTYQEGIYLAALKHPDHQVGVEDLADACRLTVISANDSSHGGTMGM